MKRMILFFILVASLAAFNQANAQFNNPSVGFGFAGGGALGDNSRDDEWVVQFRGYLQTKLISPVLLAQLGVGYTKLRAPGVYTAETGMADARLLLIPFSLEKLNPYLYAGFGFVSKDITKNGSMFHQWSPWE